MYLTACWITKNEENNIGKSIDSVKNAADDMIVVDTGSTDKTIKIAEDKGAEVLHFDWIDDFAAARNFALNNAKPGAVIFLDADEYFEEPLTASDKKKIEDMFENNKQLDVFWVFRDDIESDGLVAREDKSLRLLRNDEHLRYEGKIHEQISKDGKPPIAGFYDRKIIHTGYANEILNNKYERNIRMLDSAAAKETDSFRQFQLDLYSIRESEIINPMRSFEKLEKILPQIDNWKIGIELYGEQYKQFIITAISVAVKNRTKISRKYIKKNLFDLYVSNYIDHMSFYMNTVYFNYFNPRESLILNRINKIINEVNDKKIQKKDNKVNSILRSLYSTAAHAASKRNQTKRAAEYAVDAIDKDKFDPENAALLSMIVDYAAEKPLPEAVEILNAMYPYQETKNIRFLSEMLLREDTKELYLFYLKYLVETDAASINEILMYALLTNGVKDALGLARRALESGEKEAADTVGEFMFVLMTSFNAEAFYKSNPAGAAGFSRVLESYFSEKPLENITKEELAVFYTYYPYIVFLGGEEASAKFLNVFADSPLERFAALEDYNRRSRRFEEIFDADTSGIEDKGWTVDSPKIYAAIKLGKFDYALDNLKLTLKSFVSFDVLNMLELLAELSSGEIKKEAQYLYNDYIVRFENMVDWNDIINTNIIMDKKDVRFEKIAAKMAGKQLKQKIKDAPKKTDLSGYYEILEKVMVKYKEYDYLGQYFDGLIELIAAEVNIDENKEKLKELLKEAGNEKAEEIAALI